MAAWRSARQAPFCMATSSTVSPIPYCIVPANTLVARVVALTQIAIAQMAFETRRPERPPRGGFDQLRRRQQRSLRVHPFACPSEQRRELALRNRLHQARDIVPRRLEQLGRDERA